MKTGIVQSGREGGRRELQGDQVWARDGHQAEAGKVATCGLEVRSQRNRGQAKQRPTHLLSRVLLGRARLFKHWPTKGSTDADRGAPQTQVSAPLSCSSSLWSPCAVALTTHGTRPRDLLLNRWCHPTTVFPHSPQPSRWRIVRNEALRRHRPHSFLHCGCGGCSGLGGLEPSWLGLASPAACLGVCCV